MHPLMLTNEYYIRPLSSPLYTNSGAALLQEWDIRPLSSLLWINSQTINCGFDIGDKLRDELDTKNEKRFVFLFLG